MVDELARGLDDDGDLGPRLGDGSRDKAHVVARATRDDVDAVDGGGLLGRHVQLVHADAVVGQSAGQQALEGLGLLGDLLGHEVGVAAQRGRRGVPVDLELCRARDERAVRGHDLHRAVGRQARKLAVLELDDLRGLAGERGDVGGGVGAVARLRDDQRRAATGHDDLAGGVGRDDGERPGAAEPAARDADGLEQVTLGGTRERVLDQMSDDLGVGVGGELVAGGKKLLAKGAVVLDDAVVDDGNAPGAVQVRMGVPVGRRAVGRPARVGDAARADQVGRRATLRQGRHAPRALDAVQAAIGREHLDAGGVIAAVLEGGKALEQEGRGLSRSGISDDSAHGNLLVSLGRAPRARPGIPY